MSFPCKDCEKRHLACHDTCEEYKAKSKELFEARKARDKRGELANYIVSASHRMTKRRNSNWR